MKEIELIKENDLTKFCSDHQEQAKYLIKSTKNTYGILSNIFSYLFFPKGDQIAKDWLLKTNNPYYAEIKSYADILGLSGIYALNLSYEWGCTSGVFNNNDSLDMLRILDWPFDGLGETVCILHQHENAGDFYNITWPAISGIFQAMAPGRFAASINQAPMRLHKRTYIGDWLKNRKIFYKQSGLPPSHLLRQVFENAKDFSEAKSMLSNTPVCMPVIYTLAGIKNGEACIIERLENKTAIRNLPDNGKRIFTANHFQTMSNQQGKGWKSRAIDSKGRAQQISKIDYPGFSASDFTWLSYPMVNKLTKLCMIANAKSDRLMTQGWEEKGPVTKIYKN